MTQRAGMTEKMQEALTAIVHFIDENGKSPSIREIQKLLNLKSPSSIHRLISSLEQRGHITHQPGRARSIAIVQRKCPHCEGAI